MDKFDRLVRQTLGKYPGVCNLNRYTICPMCVMAQRQASDCGVFSENDIFRLQQNLHQLSLETSKNLRDSWKQSKIACSKHGCEVGPQLLTRLPDALLEHLTSKQRTDNMVSYLMDEVARLQAVPYSVVKKAVCKVACGFLSEAVYLASVNNIGVKSPIQVNIRGKCSGVAIYVANGSHVSILTCEHFVTGKDRVYPTLPGFRLVYLIGGKILAAAH